MGKGHPVVIVCGDGRIKKEALLLQSVQVRKEEDLKIKARKSTQKSSQANFNKSWQNNGEKCSQTLHENQPSLLIESGMQELWVIMMLLKVTAPAQMLGRKLGH